MDIDSLILENLYKEVLKEDKNDLTSWLDSGGKVHRLNGESHGLFASKLSDHNMLNPIDQLFAKRWFRITYYGDTLYCHNNVYSPNLSQMRELKNLAIENHLQSIKWDNEDQDRVLWVNKDY